MRGGRRRGEGEERGDEEEEEVEGRRGMPGARVTDRANEL